MTPTRGSLFAGIGGFDLGFKRAWFRTVDEDQLPMFPARSCMSVYNFCE